jgi:hypothetical protein
MSRSKTSDVILSTGPKTRSEESLFAIADAWRRVAHSHGLPKPRFGFESVAIRERKSQS